MAAPNPRTVYAELEKLVGSIQPHSSLCGVAKNGDVPSYCIACLYRWAYGASHDRTVGESVKTRGPSSSAVEGVAESKAASRAACRQAFRQLKSAITAIESIEPILSGALKHSDGGHSIVERYPPGSTMLTAEERQATYAAAARRRSRGEGYGDG